MALRSGGVQAADLDYVNAHATSTPLGDAVELAAISRLMSDRRVDIKMLVLQPLLD